MRSARTPLAAIVCFIAATGVARASWYDDYDAGIKAARAGNWSVVIQKMTAAIRGNPKEDNRARTYGAIFINYHPYYYRGVAYLNNGQYEQAIADLEKTTGRGELDLGPVEAHITRAKSLSEQPTPTPTPQPPVPQPQPPVPQPQPPVPVPVPVPTPQPAGIDPALRSRAQNAMTQARRAIDEARQRGATAAAEYGRAVQQFTDANSRLAAARSNDDLNAIIAAADNVSLLANSAIAPPKPIEGESLVLADTRRRVQTALVSYFNGDFDDAARAFQSLSRELPRNPWIWAFLGASQYSQYAFEADEAYRRAALESFRKAKSLRSWRGGLPEKYFSRRIRRAFENTAG